MKVIFRVHYQTQPGQALWLKLTSRRSGETHVDERMLPMRWINSRQWEVTLGFDGSQPLRLGYSYQFRQEEPEIQLDEWGDCHELELDAGAAEVILLEDTWRSAGTPDYAWETQAFRVILPARGPDFGLPHGPGQGNHVFRLRMAGLPPGQVPCLLGNARALGAWDDELARPLREVAANVWELALDLPTDAWLEYKYGRYDLTAGRLLNLETRDNRILAGHAVAAQQWTRIQDEGYGWTASELPRGAGVAIPVFSLRSQRGLGVGEFTDLKLLADWTAAAGMNLIQILPINDTTASHDWRDSYPYSAISVFALHPMYLRIDALDYTMPREFHERLDRAREQLNALGHVDYAEVMRVKLALTREIFDQHGNVIRNHAEFRKFLAANRDWLLPYAAFCVLRERFGSADFTTWNDWASYPAERVMAMAADDHPDWPELCYTIWLQYELDRQLSEAVQYLHHLGIVLKGDLPIGISRHSVDAWSATKLFKPACQAGAPPDAFAEKGQNWGFPTYDWQVMRADGYAWWRTRFTHLSRYFDAYRVDHILGFFRIWQIPLEQLDGIMGCFDPATPVPIAEIHQRGIPWEFDRYCRPYIREHLLTEYFGDTRQLALDAYLNDMGDGIYQLRGHVRVQRQILNHFASLSTDGPLSQKRLERLRDGLLECAAEVLFFEVPGSAGTQFHPRCDLQRTHSFLDLNHDLQERIATLHDDYFYRRQEPLWYAEGMAKLPVMRRASPMLLCGEDLGMVPACVPEVLQRNGILSLEIQRMPKRSDQLFSNPDHAPYLSVVSPSTHDMAPIRSWWREDHAHSTTLAREQLAILNPPADLTGPLAQLIIQQHLNSPAMWAIFPLQDLLAIHESLRHPDPEAERINIPSIRYFPWRYRMHLDLERLSGAQEFQACLRAMLGASGRDLGARDVGS